MAAEPSAGHSGPHAIGPVPAGVPDQGGPAPAVPSVVLAECVSGRQRTDAAANRFLEHCEVVEALPEQVARRAGTLRALAGRGSVTDAVVVAGAEPGGTVLTGDVADLRALAEHAEDVEVCRP